MKQPFGAKLARSCFRSMPWTAAIHKKEDAVSALPGLNLSLTIQGEMIDNFAIEDIVVEYIVEWRDREAGQYQVLIPE